MKVFLLILIAALLLQGCNFLESNAPLPKQAKDKANPLVARGWLYYIGSNLENCQLLFLPCGENDSIPETHAGTADDIRVRVYLPGWLETWNHRSADDPTGAIKIFHDRVDSLTWLNPYQSGLAFENPKIIGELGFSGRTLVDIKLSPWKHWKRNGH